MTKRILLLLSAFVLSLFACSLFSETGAPPTLEVETPVLETPPVLPVESPMAALPVPTEEVPVPTDILPPEDSVEEAILILEPGPGSRVLSPVRIAGLADPTFEQHLLVRIILDDGTEVAVTPIIIQSEMGNRGPFSIEIPFAIAGERKAFLEVSTSSPRDGGVTHLSSVIVTLADSGEQEINPVAPYPERIVIMQPSLSANISGGMAHVEGFALASFEQTLVVDVIDVEGKVVGSQPLIVEAPDLGQPGPFSADVPYTVTVSGPGRIVVRDPSVAIPGDVHLASVEINLEP